MISCRGHMQIAHSYASSKECVQYNSTKNVIVCEASFLYAGISKTGIHEQLLFRLVGFSTCLYFNSHLVLSDAVVAAASITLIDDSESSSKVRAWQPKAYIC